MSHVVTRPSAPFPIGSGRLSVHQVPSAKDNLIWLLVDTEERTATAVDGPGAGEVLEACEQLGVRLQAILNTHTHPDHIGLNLDLERRGLLRQVRVYGPPGTAVPIPGLTHPVDEGDRFEVGGETIRVLRTEGHINGHLSYVASGVVFCGDTMFGAGCGYLFDGPAAKMHESLGRLARLPGDTLVCCAHEYTEDNLRFAWTLEPDSPSLLKRIAETIERRRTGGSTVPSTMQIERDTNPFLRTDKEDVRAALRAAWPLRTLDSDVDYFAAARALKDRKDYRKLPAGELPL